MGAFASPSFTRFSSSVITFTPTLGVVANAFYAAAAGLGLPSIAALLLYASHRVQLWVRPTPEGAGFPKNPDAILLILHGMTRLIGGAAGVLGRVGQFLFNGVALISAFALIFALVLFLTGRGLHAHQGWARGFAGLITGCLLLTSLLSLTALRGPLLLLSTGLTLASAYAICAVWRGFLV
jgi:hypothetical protein